MDGAQDLRDPAGRLLARHDLADPATSVPGPQAVLRQVHRHAGQGAARPACYRHIYEHGALLASTDVVTRTPETAPSPALGDRSAAGLEDAALPPLQEYNAVEAGDRLQRRKPTRCTEATLQTRLSDYSAHLPHPRAVGTPLLSSSPRLSLPGAACCRPDRHHGERVRAVRRADLHPRRRRRGAVERQAPRRRLWPPAGDYVGRNVAAVPSLVVCAGWTLPACRSVWRSSTTPGAYATVLRVGHYLSNGKPAPATSVPMFSQPSVRLARGVWPRSRRASRPRWGTNGRHR